MNLVLHAQEQFGVAEVTFHDHDEHLEALSKVVEELQGSKKYIYIYIYIYIYVYISIKEFWRCTLGILELPRSRNDPDHLPDLTTCLT